MIKVIEHTSGVRLIDVNEHEMIVRSCENGEIYVLHGKSTNDCVDSFGENELLEAIKNFEREN